MRWVVPGIAALVSGAAAMPASAGIPVTQRMTCPIGGQAFDFTTTASYSTFGGRPDGRPYGSWTFPLAIPECPNGLIVYQRDYSDTERTRLAALIARPDYRALKTGGGTQYYRLAWLYREMERPVDDQAWALVQATWQAEAGTPLRNRYLTELAALVAGRPDAPIASRDDAALRLRWVNALRELGRFDEAAALIDRTRFPDAAAAPANERRSWTYLGETLGTLRQAIARRDASVEPLDLIPVNYAARQCVDRAASLTEWERGWCGAHEAEVSRIRGNQAASQPPPAH